MAKTKISEFSSTPANNTDIDSINIAEGCAPSNINDAIRELMAQLKDFQTGAQGDSFNGPIGTSTAAAGAFTTLSASSTTTLSGLTASTALALDASKNVVSVTNTGSGSNVLATSPTLVTPALGTPSSATLTNATGLPISTGVSGLGTGVATALAVNVGSAGAPVVNGGALGTPSSGTVTNLTGTASININGTVGATTPTTGAFTTLSASSSVTLSGGTANGVTYLNGSKVLTSGSALTFDGSTFKVAKAGGVFGPTNLVYVDVTSSYGGVTLNSASGQNCFFELYQGGTTKVGEFGIDAANSLVNIGGFGSYNTRFYASGSEQMRLNSTGLGIGTSTTTNGTKLTVAGAIAATGGITAHSASKLVIDQPNTTTSYIRSYGPNTTTAGTTQFIQASSDYSVAVSSLAIDGSGNLGLGVTPSAWSNSTAIVVGTQSALSNNANLGSSEIINNAYQSAASTYTYRYSGAASLQRQVNGQHQWFTAPSGTAGNAISFTQAMTLDASGQFLLGTTSALAWTSNTYTGTSHITVSGSGEQNIGVVSTDTNVTRAKLFVASGGQTWGLWNDGSALKPFVVGGYTSEWMRIDSSGNLLVGTTSISYDTTPGFVARTDGRIIVSNNTSGASVFNKVSSSGGDAIYFQAAGFTKGSIVISSSATAYNTSSDYRLKNTIAPMTGALAKVAQLKPVTYKWNADGSDGEGFIAHELAEVVPQCVTGEKDAVDEEGNPKYQGIDVSFLVATLTAAIQELKASMDAVKAEFDAYKASHP